MKWIVEYTAEDPHDDPTWIVEESVEAGTNFQEFEHRFLEARDGAPAEGYYRIQMDGVALSTNTYLWGPEGHLLMI
jgi:hypothetical protein